jgi:hypothetical protein
VISTSLLPFILCLRGALSVSAYPAVLPCLLYINLGAAGGKCFTSNDSPRPCNWEEYKAQWNDNIKEDWQIKFYLYQAKLIKRLREI